MKLRDYIEELQQSSLGHTNPVVIELLLAIGLDKLDREIDQITKEAAKKVRYRSDLMIVQQIFTLIQTHYKEKFPYGGDDEEFLNYKVYGDTLTIRYTTWNNYKEDDDEEEINVPSDWLTMDEQTLEKNVIRWFKLKRLHFQLENTESAIKSSHAHIANCELEINLLREKILNLEKTRQELLEEIENENRS